MLRALTSRSLFPLRSTSPIYNFCESFSSKLSYSTLSSSECSEKLRDVPVDRIRNFCIIAHVDHGKTTLSTRLMELTDTLASATGAVDYKQAIGDKDLYLDKLQVEKERGITVKAQTCSMFYEHNSETYLLNLVDTPGHVDFTYEVSRAMTACEGAILVVDAAQGIQAQTLANTYLALEAELEIIPIINKIDLPYANVAKVTDELVTSLGVNADDILLMSARTGEGVDKLLPLIIEKLPSPRVDTSCDKLKALLFDNWYDRFRGIVCNMKLLSGTVKKGDSISFSQTGKTYEVHDVGIMNPEQKVTKELFPGQVGWVIPNMRTVQEARVGDTVFRENEPVEPLPGFQPYIPVVYAGIYPTDPEDINALSDAINKLTLSDASVEFRLENSAALGMGFRCGFLGVLHMEVFTERITQEYDLDVIITQPTVPFKAILRNGEEVNVRTATDYPNPSSVETGLEPRAKATIVIPTNYMGSLLQLMLSCRGEQVDIVNMGDDRVTLIYDMPLDQLIQGFYTRLKEVTSGYASFDYEDNGYRKANVSAVSILINDEPVEPLSFIVHSSQAVTRAKEFVEKLRKAIPRQLIKIKIQATIGTKVIARADIGALRKDVTSKCYGGDITRKKKLLEKQKKGKKKMREFGKVQVGSDVFRDVLKF